MSKFRFQGGEVVRLRDNRDGVSAGCCGIVWGVYDIDTPVYEATFVDLDGAEVDVMFGEADVDQLDDIDQTPCRERLVEIKRVIFREGRDPHSESGA